MMFRILHGLPYLLVCVLFGGCMAKANYQDPVKLDQSLPVDPGLYQATLDNGFRYWIRSTNASGSNHTIHMRLIVFVGSVDEADDERGYTHLLEHVLYRAVEKSAGLNKLMRDAGLSWGADVNAFTYQDRTEYRFSFSGEQLDVVPRALKFSALLLDNVKILDKHVLAEKPIVEAEWRARESSDSAAPGAFSRALFGNTRWLHRPPQGSLGDLRAASSDSVQRYWDKYYQPRNAMIIVTGKVDPFDLSKQIEKEFARLGNRSAKPERFADTDQYRTRAPIEVVGFNDQGAHEPYVRGHVFLPSTRIDSYRSFRDSVLDELAMEMIAHAQSALVAGHPQCTGYNSTTRVAARRPKIFEFELIPVNNAGFIDCAELLQGSLGGISDQLIDRRTFTKLRTRAEKGIRATFTDLRVQSPREMVETLSQKALHGNRPMSPAFVVREFDTIVKTISNDDIRQRVRAMLSKPVLYEFGAPPHVSGSLPDDAAAMSRLQRVRPVIAKQATPISTALDQPGSRVTADASIATEVVDDEWIKWTLSNGVTVVHYPSKEHEGLVALSYVDDGGYVNVPDDTVNAARYLTRYHDDVAMGQLSADELQIQREDSTIYLETKLSMHSHGVTGAVVKENVSELFDVFAAVFQPLRKTADTQGFIARARHWQQARASGAQAVWQQYWRHMVSGAPDALARDRTAPFTYVGLVRAHNVLFQRATDPVVVVYGDITASAVKKRLIDTFGAINSSAGSAGTDNSEAGNTDYDSSVAVQMREAGGSRLSYRQSPAGSENLTVAGRGQAGALLDTVDVHLIQHCADSDVDYPKFVEGNSIIARLVAGSVTSRIREQLGLAYAPSVSIGYTGMESQVAQYHIKVTTGLSDASRVRRELGNILARIGSKGFAQKQINSALNTINSNAQLDAKYSIRRVSQIANKLLTGVAPDKALRIKSSLVGAQAFKVVNQIARGCFGKQSIKPLTITHQGQGS